MSFPTTSWSLVVAAGQTPTLEARGALEALCARYWHPVYAFLRKKGYDIEAAQDLTQGYFTRLLEKHYLNDVHQDRGRFRSFLLASVRHYVANERDRERTRRRGNGAVPIPMTDAEGRLRFEPSDASTPESVFEKQWALTVIDHAMRRLQKQPNFDRLTALITDDAASYVKVAEECGMTEGAVRVAVHRMRRRFRDAVRAEVRETVDGEQEIDDELRFLLAALET